MVWHMLEDNGNRDFEHSPSNYITFWQFCSQWNEQKLRLWSNIFSFGQFVADCSSLHCEFSSLQVALVCQVFYQNKKFSLRQCRCSSMTRCNCTNYFGKSSNIFDRICQRTHVYFPSFWKPSWIIQWYFAAAVKYKIVQYRWS